MSEPKVPKKDVQRLDKFLLTSYTADVTAVNRSLIALTVAQELLHLITG